MIKLNANLCKKVPIVGKNYSSQSFMAGLEVEISDAASSADMQQRIREVYALLERSIDEQVARHENTAQTGSGQNFQEPRSNSFRRGADRNQSRGRNDYDRPAPASQAQLKAIAAISGERQLSDNDLHQLTREQFRKNSPQELTLREASRLIGLLKDQQRQAG